MKKKLKTPPRKQSKSLYEGHITCDVRYNHERVWLDKFGRSNRWKTSWIMNDPKLGDRAYFYFTRYSFSALKLKALMLDFGKDIPVDVVRYKIEKIIWDEKL